MISQFDNLELDMHQIVGVEDHRGKVSVGFAHSSDGVAVDSVVWGARISDGPSRSTVEHTDLQEASFGDPVAVPIEAQIAFLIFELKERDALIAELADRIERR